MSLNLFRSLALAGWGWRSSLSQASRVSVWFPFLIIAAAQVLVLWFLVSFHQRWALPLSLPIVKWTGGEAATHYPDFFYLLPVMYARAMLVVVVFVASIATGAATVLFARSFGHETRESAWQCATRHAPKLITIAIISTLLFIGVSTLLAQVPSKLILENRMVRWSTRGAVLLGALLVESFFAYATAWIVLERAGLWTAIRDSFRVTAKTLLPTLLLVGVPVLLLYPFGYLSERVDIFATKVAPETLAGLLLTRIGFEFVLSFLLVGAITRLFVWRMEGAR